MVTWVTERRGNGFMALSKGSQSLDVDDFALRSSKLGFRVPRGIQTYFSFSQCRNALLCIFSRFYVEQPLMTKYSKAHMARRGASSFLLPGLPLC